MKRKCKRVLAMLLSAVLLVSLLPTGAFAAGAPFRDVTQGQWYFDAVSYVNEQGLMSGVSATQFSPNANITRAQMCQILYNLEGQPAVTTDAFSDISRSAWYFQAVNWAAAQGIVSGVGNDRFAPDTAITREQLVLILYRYGSFIGYDIEDTVSIDDFADHATVSTWAEEAVQWAVGDGILSGSDNRLNPGGTATRAETATIMMRFDRQVEQYFVFKSKSISDFAEYEVINFDDSEEDNFAVLHPDAVSSETSGTTNQLIRMDDENGVYVFEHADDSLLGLEPGDIFYHVYGDGEAEYLLFKIDTAETDGTTVTLTAGQADLSDYFSYIDLAWDGVVSASDFDPSDADEGVTYLGTEAGTAAASAVQPDSDVLAQALGGMPQTLARSISGSAGTNFKFGVMTDSFDMTVKVNLKFTLKIEYDSIFTGIDAVQFSVKQDMDLEGKLKNGTAPDPAIKKKLGDVTIPITTGVEANLAVYIVADANAAAEGTIALTVSSETGTRYSDGKSKPIKKAESELSADIGGDFELQAGLNLTGKIQVIKLLHLSLSGEGGGKLTGDAETPLSASSDRVEKHLCALCIDGAVSVYFDMKLDGKLGISEKTAKKFFEFALVNAEVQIMDFYLSFPSVAQKPVFGKGSCPNKAYQVCVSVLDQVNAPVAGAAVSIVNSKTGHTAAYGDTDAAGQLTVYCSPGSYSAMAGGPDGYQVRSEEQAFTLTDQGAAVRLKLNNENAQVEIRALTDFMGLTVQDIMQYLDASDNWHYEDELLYMYEWPCFNYISNSKDYLLFSLEDGGNHRETLYENAEMLNQYNAYVYYGRWDGDFRERLYVNDTLVGEYSFMPCNITALETEPYQDASLPVCAGIPADATLSEIAAACEQHGYPYEIIEDEGGFTYYEIEPSVRLTISYADDISVRFVWRNADRSSAASSSASSIYLLEPLPEL